MGSLIKCLFTALTFLFVIISKDIIALSTENFSDVALRVVGGTVVKNGDLPYVAGLEITFKKNENLKTICTGSLISFTSILTAGHCVRKVKEVKVTLGATNLTQHSTDERTQTFVSTHFIMHPNYRHSKKLNDIGIIKLPYPAKINEHVKIISIPTDDKVTYIGKSGTVMGWGKTSDAQTQGNLDTLRSVNNTIISNEDCINSLPDFHVFITDKYMCQSGEGGKTGCIGDSGAPLVVDGIQIGIMAFGYRLCEEGYPTAFTRVSKYIEWIKANE